MPLVVGIRARTIHSTLGRRGRSLDTLALDTRSRIPVFEANGGVRWPGVDGGVKAGDTMEAGKAGVADPELSSSSRLGQDGLVSTEIMFSRLGAGALVGLSSLRVGSEGGCGGRW